MLLSLLIVLIIAFGGLALTYVFEREESFLWRMAAGNVIGSAIFGTVGFVLASFFGFNTAIVLTAIVVTLLPCLLLRQANQKKIFLHDWAKAKGKLQGANWTKAARFAYYAFFLIVFLAFFERAMFVTDEGIFTGGSNNLGDLPFHLGAIFGFTEGNNFPPQNPSFAGARFSYPFIADFLTASFMKLGVGVREAMLVQNVSWAFSLLVILERFVFKLTFDRLASKIAPALLFFTGGLGFIWFFGDYWAQGKGFFDFIWTIPKDYTIGQEFRWGNSMVTLFMTQRSLLLGMPLTLIVLSYLWKVFTAETPRPENDEAELATHRLPLTSFAVGLIAGFLPLIHLHSLAVLFLVTVFLLALKPARWRDWIGFGAGVAVIAVPELLWSISGSATETGKFFEFHFGWDSGQINFLWFWIKNTGILFAMIGAGIYLVYLTQGLHAAKEETRKIEKTKKGKGLTDSPLIPYPQSLLLFYVPFAFLFILSNVTKLAPWEWDNIKVLIYWFVGSIPFIAFALAWLWRKTTAFQVIAAVCLIVLIFSGALDVWRTASGQINFKVFEADGVLVAERIKQRTPQTSLFLNAPTYNSAVVLSGRQSLMRYPGHLGSHGIDYTERERDVKSMYAGGPAASALLQKYGIDYVLISPEEKSAAGANEAFFSQFPVIAEAGQYKVYKIK
ncbi:MAG: hypothetical protein H7070_11400 [Saprospiraceae bacterium]|nr:hypothetical protein [Pyrinomonadaceae bacterium]